MIIPEAVVAELEDTGKPGQGDQVFRSQPNYRPSANSPKKIPWNLKFVKVKPVSNRSNRQRRRDRRPYQERGNRKQCPFYCEYDIVQAEVARAKGLDVVYLKPQMEEFGALWRRPVFR